MTDDNPSSSEASVWEDRLRHQLHAASTDPAGAARVVARAQLQGHRQVRRRRLLSAGALTALVAGLGVGGAPLSGTALSPAPVAAHGDVRTVPQRTAHAEPTPVFVVDPAVKQRAEAAFAAAVSATLPEAGTGRVEVSSSSLELPLSTGQRGWTWTSQAPSGDSATSVWLDVDQFKAQPPLAVSPCVDQDQVQCSYEVLPEGGYVVSGYLRGSAELSDGRQVQTARPYARLTRADGRVIDAQTMSVPTADADSGAGTITPQALRALVTDQGLGNVPLPTAARVD